jgi:hypothetical protein
VRRTRWLVVVPCAIGIAVAGVWVGQAISSPTRRPFGLDAGVLAFVVACLVFRLCVDLSRFRRSGDGLVSNVVSLSAALVVVLVSLAWVLNGVALAGVILVCAALLAIPLSLAAWVLWG